MKETDRIAPSPQFAGMGRRSLSLTMDSKSWRAELRGSRATSAIIGSRGGRIAVGRGRRNHHSSVDCRCSSLKPVSKYAANLSVERVR